MPRSPMFLLVILLTGCATGSAIVTGDKRPPTDPAEVKLYLSAPPEYEEIGLVKAKSGAGGNQQKSRDYAVEELKKQAAKLGANGVLILTTGTQTSTMVGGYGTGIMYAVPVETETVEGIGIFVP
jgi:hypothetical protein